jgi:hypothetical protein
VAIRGLSGNLDAGGDVVTNLNYRIHLAENTGLSKTRTAGLAGEQTGHPGTRIVGRDAAACQPSRVSVTILEREMYTEAAAARLRRSAMY